MGVREEGRGASLPPGDPLRLRVLGLARGEVGKAKLLLDWVVGDGAADGADRRASVLAVVMTEHGRREDARELIGRAEQALAFVEARRA